MMCYIILSLLCLASYTEEFIPGVSRYTNNVFLIENHNNAYTIWHILNISNSILIHLDTHDDCRYVSPSNIQRILNLLKEKKLYELYSFTDISFNFSYGLKNRDFLFDLGNFIYPCFIDKTITNLIWIIPDKEIDMTKALSLKNHFLIALNSTDLTFYDELPRRFSITSSNITITVATLYSIPNINMPVLLDIDIDFFVFPSALSEDHLFGKLSHSPQETCFMLKETLKTNIMITTICSSVEGGYTPLIWRFLADALFEYFSTGKYPDEAKELEKIVIDLQNNILTDIYTIKTKLKAFNLFQSARDYIISLSSLIEGNTQLAVKYLLNASKTYKIYSKGFLDLAEASIYMKRYDDAITFLKEHEKLHPQAYSPRDAMLCRLFIAKGEIDKAYNISKKLIEWEKQPYHNLLYAGILYQKGELNKAKKIYEEILQTKPMDAVANYNLGVLYANQGKTEEAIKFYKKALAIRPFFIEALENLGFLYLEKNMLHEAELILKKAFQLRPMNISTIINLGLVYYRLKNYKEAERYFKEALRLNPNIAESHANLAGIFLEKGELQNALYHAERAMELNPDSEEIKKLYKEIKNQ